MFQFLGIWGWEELQKQWENIYVSMETGQPEVVVAPRRRYRKGGYGSRDDDPVYRCRFTAEEVGEAVRRGIDRPAPEPLLTAEDESELGIELDDEQPAESSAVSPTSPLVQPLQVGDRVADTWGNRGMVTQVDPAAEHGLGIVRVRFDDGRESSFSLVASGLERII